MRHEDQPGGGAGQARPGGLSQRPHLPRQDVGPGAAGRLPGGRRPAHAGRLPRGDRPLPLLRALLLRAGEGLPDCGPGHHARRAPEPSALPGYRSPPPELRAEDGFRPHCPQGREDLQRHLLGSGARARRVPAGRQPLHAAHRVRGEPRAAHSRRRRPEHGLPLLAQGPLPATRPQAELPAAPGNAYRPPARRPQRPGARRYRPGAHRHPHLLRRLLRDAHRAVRRPGRADHRPAVVQHGPLGCPLALRPPSEGG